LVEKGILLEKILYSFACGDIRKKREKKNKKNVKKKKKLKQKSHIQTQE
jgi:hypothetical protein